MAGMLYAEKGKMYCNDYMEIYIPKEYFVDGRFAVNMGSSIETFGLLYIRSYANGQEGPIKLLNVPVIINLMLYDFQDTTIKIHGMPLDVLALKYIKGSCVMHQSIQKGREVAEIFLNMMLMGKIPKTTNYIKTINIWWKNLEIADVTFKVPSKTYEMIIASIYRNPNNLKERFGQYYGKQSSPNGYDYKTGSVRAVVKDSSTFSGMVYEDISSMISNGIVNSQEGNEEPVSPLEKIIHY